MQKLLKYTVFKTKWGYFGLAGTERGLYQTCLPLSEPEQVELELLKNLPPVPPRSGLGAEVLRNKHRRSSIEHQVSSTKFDKGLFKTLQQQITAYFEGAYVSFGSDIPIILDSLSPFARSVLTACRAVEFGQVVTYSELAKKLERPGAARAVGNALAKNPLPLIIPCHRVVRSPPDVWRGRIGGFSAPGGKDLKAKLLRHEQASLANHKSH